MSEKFDRYLRMLNLLDLGKICTINNLAEEFEVDPRTIRRDLEELQYAGFPISFDKAEKSYVFDRGFKLKKALMDTEEILALAMAKKLIPTLGASFEAAFRKVEQKILESSKPVGKRLDKVPVFLAPQEKPNFAELTGLLKDLSRASTEYLLVKITYQNLYDEKIHEREVEPYYLLFAADGFWVLRAFCRLRQEWRTFALDRIQEWKVLERYFVPRSFGDTFDQELAEWFGGYRDGALEEIIVHFSPIIRQYIERKKWHPTQQTAILPDGSIELKITASGIEGVKPWLYQWIPNIRVIKPQWLRDELVADLKQQLSGAVDL